MFDFLLDYLKRLLTTDNNYSLHFMWELQCIWNTKDGVIKCSITDEKEADDLIDIVSKALQINPSQINKSKVVSIEEVELYRLRRGYFDKPWEISIESSIIKEKMIRDIELVEKRLHRLVTKYLADFQNNPKSSQKVVKFGNNYQIVLHSIEKNSALLDKLKEMLCDPKPKWKKSLDRFRHETRVKTGTVGHLSDYNELRQMLGLQTFESPPPKEYITKKFTLELSTIIKIAQKEADEDAALILAMAGKRQVKTSILEKVAPPLVRNLAAFLTSKVTPYKQGTVTSPITEEKEIADNALLDEARRLTNLKTTPRMSSNFGPKKSKSLLDRNPVFSSSGYLDLMLDTSGSMSSIDEADTFLFDQKSDRGDEKAGQVTLGTNTAPVNVEYTKATEAWLPKPPLPVVQQSVAKNTKKPAEASYTTLSNGCLVLEPTSAFPSGKNEHLRRAITQMNPSALRVSIYLIDDTLGDIRVSSFVFSSPISQHFQSTLNQLSNTPALPAPEQPTAATSQSLPLRNFADGYDDVDVYEEGSLQPAAKM